MTATDASLRGAAQPPAYGSEEFLSERWESVRDSGILPLHQSKLASDMSARREFLEGAKLLGVFGKRKELKPQQLRLADVCAVPASRVGVLMPRRSTKTTSLFAVGLGRCAEREEYLVAYTTCTTGTKARQRFKQDIVKPLEKAYPDPRDRPFRIYTSGGSERIEFANGSVFQVLPPIGESFRSDAWDMIILDEAGEASPEMTEDLLAGALATMDTRPDAQLVVAGTAAKFRDGNLLWSSLERGRAGGASIIEYAAPDDTNLEDIDKSDPGNWDATAALASAAHPGIGTLTTLDVMRERWEELTPRQFAEEYLSIFGTVGAAEAFVDLEAWQDGAVKGDLPPMPTDRAVGLAIAVHPDQSCAAIMAAWRDDAGKACLLVVDSKAGTKWLAKRAKELAAKLRTPIVYDNAGPVLVEVEVMQRMRPRPRMDPQTWANVSTAAGLFMKENGTRNVVHWDQEELNTAVRLATKRGTPTSNRWAFGRREPGQSIICLEAGSLALRWADEHPKRAKAKAFAV